jgi:hypothetical protein
LIDELAKLATVVKLNEDEQATVADVLDLPARSMERFARAMAARYQLRGVCVTRGPLVPPSCSVTTTGKRPHRRSSW